MNCHAFNLKGTKMRRKRYESCTFMIIDWLKLNIESPLTFLLFNPCYSKFTKFENSILEHIQSLSYKQIVCIGILTYSGSGGRIWVLQRIIKSRLFVRKLDFKNTMRRRYKDLLLSIASWDWSSSLTRKFLEYIIGIVLSTVVKTFVRFSERVSDSEDGPTGTDFEDVVWILLIRVIYTLLIILYDGCLVYIDWRKIMIFIKLSTWKLSWTCDVMSSRHLCHHLSPFCYYFCRY